MHLVICFFLSVKRRRSRVLSADMKQHQEYIQTEEWTCVKSIKENKVAAQEDVKIEVDDKTS